MRRKLRTKRDYSICSETLTLQWHITSRCNMRCLHCYQEGYDSKDTDFDMMVDILNQYKELLGTLKRKGHVNITGGEPFIHGDFFKLLELLSQESNCFSFGILTNGSFIDRDAALRLKDLGPAFVQLSIEGDQSTHDMIRGKGNLDSVLSAARHLSKSGIKTLVSFTAHKHNYKSFPEVVKLCRSNNVFKVWTDRLVPFGGAEKIKDSCLSSEETWEYINIIMECKKQKAFWFGNKTIVEMGRALQFLANGGMPYRCKAGDRLITILEDGTVLPCRRLPIPAGNVREASLKDIYHNSEVLKSLRCDFDAPEGCRKCSYFMVCKGGARCISYAVTGSYYSRDPGCPIVWNNRE